MGKKQKEQEAMLDSLSKLLGKKKLKKGEKKAKELKGPTGRRRINKVAIPTTATTRSLPGGVRNSGDSERIAALQKQIEDLRRNKEIELAKVTKSAQQNIIDGLEKKDAKQGAEDQKKLDKAAADRVKKVAEINALRAKGRKVKGLATEQIKADKQFAVRNKKIQGLDPKKFPDQSEMLGNLYPDNDVDMINSNMPSSAPALVPKAPSILPTRKQYKAKVDRELKSAMEKDLRAAKKKLKTPKLPKAIPSDIPQAPPQTIDVGVKKANQKRKKAIDEHEQNVLIESNNLLKNVDSKVKNPIGVSDTLKKKFRRDAAERKVKGDPLVQRKNKEEAVINLPFIDRKKDQMLVPYKAPEVVSDSMEISNTLPSQKSTLKKERKIKPEPKKEIDYNPDEKKFDSEGKYIPPPNINNESTSKSKLLDEIVSGKKVLKKARLASQDDSREDPSANKYRRLDADFGEILKEKIKNPQLKKTSERVVKELDPSKIKQLPQRGPQPTKEEKQQQEAGKQLNQSLDVIKAGVKLRKTVKVQRKPKIEPKKEEPKMEYDPAEVVIPQANGAAPIEIQTDHTPLQPTAPVVQPTAPAVQPTSTNPLSTAALQARLDRRSKKKEQAPTQVVNSQPLPVQSDYSDMPALNPDPSINYTSIPSYIPEAPAAPTEPYVISERPVIRRDPARPAARIAANPAAHLAAIQSRPQLRDFNERVIAPPPVEVNKDPFHAAMANNSLAAQLATRRQNIAPDDDDMDFGSGLLGRSSKKYGGRLNRIGGHMDMFYSSHPRF